MFRDSNTLPGITRGQQRPRGTLAAAVIAAALAVTAVTLTSPATAEPAPRPNGTTGSGQATWKVLVLDYQAATSGARTPQDKPATRRMSTELTRFRQDVKTLSDGKVRVKVSKIKAGTWPGYRPDRTDLESAYDLIIHRYPRYSTDPPASYSEPYIGLAAMRWIELPVTVVDTPRCPETRRSCGRTVSSYVRSGSSSVIFHEFMHVLTNWLKDSGAVTDADLPPGNVHGRPVHYPSDVMYYQHYFLAQVDMRDGGKKLGLGVGRIVGSGTPTDPGWIRRRG